MAPMIGLEVERLAVAVGDEGVELVEREVRELAARGRSDTAHDEPDRSRIPAVGERGIARLGHVGVAVEPVRDRRPRRLGDRLDEATDAAVLAHRDAERTSIARHTATTAWA
jgi:hypothetical protein